MFEKILERILLTYFGKFISGFDKNNLSLGVWSGNIVIENVSLKPDIINLLELPVTLKFSSLGRMILKVPRNKLSSSPVEVILEDILIVLNPLKEQQWKYDDSQQLQKKFNKLLKIVRKHLTDKKKEAIANEKGYMEKLTIKIIDNLQVSLKNIHFRYEDTSFSWGIKLDLLEAMTTDDDFHICFIDRSDSKNVFLARNKLISLKNLQFYWNLNETLFLSEFTPSQQLITEEVIRISAHCKLVLNSQVNFDKPLYDMNMELESISINLKHSQLKQMIQVLELFTTYKKFQDKKKIIQEHTQQQQQEFIELMIKYHKTENLAILAQNKELLYIQEPTLVEWTKLAIKQLLLDQKMQELQKQKQKKGWFRMFNRTDSEISENELQDLQEYVDKSLDELDASKVIRPGVTQKVRFNLKLKGAQIQLVKDNGTLADEGIQQSLTRVSLEWEQKENKDFFLTFSVQGIAMQIVSKQTVEQICKPTIDSQEFIRFNVIKSQTKLDVKFLMQSLTCTYNPSVVRIGREILKVKQGQFVESTLKTATWDKLEQIQDQTSSKVRKLLESAVELSIDAEIVKPILYLPFPLSSEKWLLKMDSLQFQSVPNQENIYETFQLRLVNGCFEYIPDITTQLNVVERYSFLLELGRLKNGHLNLMKEQSKPLLKVHGKFEPFIMILNEKVYRDLVYLPETIFPQQNQQQTLQQLQMQKELIQKNKVKGGYILKCGTLIRSWTKNYAILCESDVYFYDQEQTLMHNSQINIYNSHVSRLIVDDQQYAFKITNKQGEYVFACENDTDLEEWIYKLNNQIQEFITLNEKQQKKLLEKKQTDYMMDIQISIKKAQVKIYKENNYPSMYQEYLLFLFKINQFNYSHSQEGIKIMIESLSLQDWTYDFDHKPEYQDLLVISSNQSRQSVIVKINHGKQVQLNLDTLNINWKPDSFLKMRELLQIIKNRKSRKWYFANIRDYEVEQLKRGSNCDYEEVKKQKLIDGLNRDAIKCMRFGQSKLQVKEKFFTLLDYDQFIQDYAWIENVVIKQFPAAFKSNTSKLFEIQGQINSANVNFFHRTTHSHPFRLETTDIKFQFIKLQFSNFFDCGVNEVTFFETMNYPQTKQNAKITPHKLLYRRGEYKENMLRIRFGGHDQIILANKDRTVLFILLEFNPVIALYQHQPIMRMIDYLINQIVTLLKEPEALTMNTAFIEQKRRKTKQNSLKAKRAWGDVDFIQSKFICPTFLDLRINLTRPLAIVKGWPEFEQYFQLEAEKIEVYNSQKVDQLRLLKEGGQQLIKVQESWLPDGRIKIAWSEAYCIEGRNMQLQYFDKQPQGISTPINFNLSFERLLHFNEVNEIYNNVEYDRSIRIRSSMTPIVLKLYRKEYLEICKMIFHNFTYDDQNDKQFIHDFEVARSFEPAPISFWLDFQEVQIFALSRLIPTPHIQIHMDQLRLEWARQKDVALNLFGKFISMYHYEDDYEIGFVGNLKRKEQLKPKGQMFNLDIDAQYYDFTPLQKVFMQYEFPNFNEEDVQFTMLFHIIRPLGDKECNITLRNVKMVVEPTVFANVGLWSKLEQPCWPPQVEFGEMPSIKLIVEILNTSLCLQSNLANQILATKGDLSYVWNRSRFIHPEKLVSDSKSGKLDKLVIDSIGEAFEHKVNLRNLELFKCLYDDFVSYKITEVHKRHIMLPFSLFFSLKNELQMDYMNHFVYFNNKFQLSIDKTICKFSYQDLVLVLSISNRLKSSKTQIIREPIYEEIVQQYTPPVNNIYDAIISGLQVVVINDAGEAYVPVFDLTLSETQLQFQQTNLKSIFSTVIRLQSTFYNPKIAIWEPIVESCMFSLDVSLNPLGDPQKIIFLEMAQQKQILNINISAQMISVFHKTLLSWQKEIQNQKQQKKIQLEELDEKKELQLSKQQSNLYQHSQQFLIQSLADQETENIDHVSPYTIRNESGFIIEVEDRDIRKYVLKSGTSVNFQIDSEIEQVFAREDQNKQRLVSIRVIHPDYQFDAIPQVDLDAIRVTRVAIKPTNQCQDQTFMLFIEVVPKDTRKLLLISSEMIIFNKTNMIVELKMFHLDGVQEQDVINGSVDPQRAFSVPFDRTRQYFCFCFNGYQDYCKHIDLYYLAESSDRKYEQHHSENHFTIVRCSKRNVNQTLVYLEPPFEIKNCLPLDIGFELYGDGKVITDVDSLLLSADQPSLSNFKPLIIEKSQYENLVVCEKGVLLKQESKQIHTISIKGRMAIKIKLPFYNLSDMTMLHMPKMEIPFTIEAISLCDYRGNTGQILVDQIKNHFFLYTPTFAVNELPSKLFYYQVPEQKKITPSLLAGQSFKEIPLDENEEKSRIIILGSLQNLMISAYDNSLCLSEPINLNYTGNQTIKLQNEQYIQELGYNISLVCVDKQKPLVTKVLTISPRFVIINQTNFQLNVLQHKTINQIEIPSQERAPFYWSELKSQLLKFQIEQDTIIWEYSNPINPNTTGFSCFTLRANNNISIVKHMNCIVRVDNQIIYLIVLECRAPSKQITNSGVSNLEQKDLLVDPPYIIVNNLNLVTLICYQYCCQEQQYQDMYPYSEYKHFINSTTQAPFSWEFPNEKRELMVQVKFEGDYSTQYQMNPLFFNLEEADAAIEYVVHNQVSESEEFKFYVISSWEGSSRKLKFVQDPQLQQDERNLLKLDIQLSNIGISLIDMNNNKRVELIYVLLRGVDVNIQQTTEVRKSELRIKYINVDYNTNYKTMFPVIFTPTKYQEIFEYNRPHLALVMEQSTQVNSVSLIKNIKACLQPSTIRLTSETLEQLYAVFKQISQSFKTNIISEEQTKQFDFEYSIQQEEQEQQQQINSAALSNKVQAIYGIGSQPFNNQVEWEKINVSHSDKATYINKIEIYPLSFNLNFYNQQTSNQNYNIFMQILKTIGIVLANIDEAPIMLDGIYLENSFDTTSAIATKLMTHYKDKFINLLLKVLGSIELIGNPVGLVKHLARGVYDLIDKPIEGFIKGPIEGGIGIAKGVGSLVQNTITGTFNSTSKIAGSISGGLAAISMDTKYKVKREQYKVMKPNQFFQGVYLGSIMLGYGVERAIVGVIDIPLQQGKKKGLKGALIGTLEGATGFFIKPFSGMFDFICKTTDGVKATAQYWNDKPNDKRVRDIRTMYQIEQFYKPFNEKDAKLMSFLASISTKYSKINYFDSFEYEENLIRRGLVLSVQMIIYLDLKKKKIIWIVDPKLVQSVAKFERGVIYQLKDYNDKLKSQQAIIQVETYENLKEYMVKQSKYMLKNLS